MNRRLGLAYRQRGVIDVDTDLILRHSWRRSSVRDKENVTGTQLSFRRVRELHNT